MTPPAPPHTGRTAETRGSLAVLTPPGRGGIAVIRCIGYAAQAALLRCFRPLASRKTAGLTAGALPAPGTLAYGHLLDADGRPLDEIILYNSTQVPLTPSLSPHGGERVAEGRMRGRPVPIFEVNCHGGPAAVQAACQHLEALGLTHVGPDRLMELEGVPRLEREARAALRRATTPLAARILLSQLNGALAGAIGRARDDLGAGRAPAALAILGDLLSAWQTCGRLLARPPRVAIAGRPNSGKSTLLNRLVGTDRVITSPAPGTTRDTVEAEAALQGAPVVLIDTAGLREAGGPIERHGVERAWAELARADAVVYLVDATAGLTPEDEAAQREAGDRAIIAWNKVDSFPPPPAAAGALGLSALTGRSVEALTQALLDRLGWRPPAAGRAVPFTAAQAEALAAARAAAEEGHVEEALRRLEEMLQ
jgi:tRNA modification GTPase